MKKNITILIVICLLAAGILTGCSKSSYLQKNDETAQKEVSSGDAENSTESCGADKSEESAGSGNSDKSDGSTGSGNSDKSDGSAKLGNSSKSKDSIFVHVAGAVNAPGVYELSNGARICKAIEAAGGLTEDADDFDINQASVLTDGQKIYVYRKGEDRTDWFTSDVQSADGQVTDGSNADGQTTDGSNVNTGNSQNTGVSNAGSNAGGNSSGLVNINTASVDELMTLSGIGESKAKAIIAYRQDNGSFSKIEDIKNVSGIGDGTFSKIKDQITT